jgi:hypothetical protein
MPKQKSNEPPVRVRIVGTDAQIDACLDRLVEILFRDKEPVADEPEITVVRATPRRKLSRQLRNAVDADDETAPEIARQIAGVTEFDVG